MINRFSQRIGKVKANKEIQLDSMDIDLKNGLWNIVNEEPKEPDFDDAKYMIVSCSAFVNYLIGKAEKIGIKIK